MARNDPAVRISKSHYERLLRRKARTGVPVAVQVAQILTAFFENEEASKAKEENDNS